MVATVPTRHLAHLHEIFAAPSKATPKQRPHIPEKYAHYLSFGAELEPLTDRPLFFGRTPSLAEAVEWLVGMTTSSEDIVRKHGTQKRANILLREGDNALSDVRGFGVSSVSSASSLSSISVSGSSSGGGTSDGSDSGTGSASDSSSGSSSAKD